VPLESGVRGIVRGASTRAFESDVGLRWITEGAVKSATVRGLRCGFMMGEGWLHVWVSGD